MSEVVTFSKVGRIGVATVNNPPVNALSQAVRAGLSAVVDAALADPEVAALVILCEGRTFIAGADIREFGKPPQPPILTEVVTKLENANKPVVAAIHGTALGGGFEVALACHFRVAVASAKVGLPEVKLGILPGAGGTQRLPRLIGADAALRLIIDGTHVPAPEAAELGAIDEIVEGDLKTGALAFAERAVAEKWPLRRTGSLAVKVSNPAVFEEAAKTARKRQRGYEAPLKCIEAVKLATELPLEEGLVRERAIFMELLGSTQSRALRHAFAAEREVAKIAGLPADAPTRTIAQAAIIGTGTMGGGIAMCFANAGITVTFIGQTDQLIEQGLATIRKNYANTVARGGLSQAEMDKRLAQFHPSTSYEAAKDADLVIEAVFEEMPIKKEVFGKLDRICKPGAILASNTSYLNIDEIAASTSRPQDVVGMHFFSPANVMKLLENVRGAKTAPDVLSTVMKVGKTIGKVPVLVGVCDGFVGNRMLSKRGREGMFMLEEGATPWQIDKVLYDFGFPMGPYAVGDLAGLDIGWANRKSRLDRLTPRERACNIVDKICELGRFGQKTGAGFYKYDDKRNATPDPVIEELIVQHSAERGIARRAISDQEIIERSLYSMINEGAKILEEGVVSRPDDIDIVWLYGYGFPAYRGGPMWYADTVGVKNVYDSILRYRDQVGPEYFTPAPLLEQLAREGKGFYSR
jgi:3-hydroxyacyl-CoA dehydrogenase